MTNLIFFLKAVLPQSTMTLPWATHKVRVAVAAGGEINIAIGMGYFCMQCNINQRIRMDG